MQDFAAEEAVGPARHRIIGERRQFLRAAVESDRQLPGRRDLPEQDIGDRRAAAGPRIERLHHRSGIRLGDRQRTARKHDKDDRPADRRDLFDQHLLETRQLKAQLVARCIRVVCVARLPLDARVEPDADDRNVGAFRRGNRLGQPVAVLGAVFGPQRNKFAAARVNDAALPRERLLNPGQHRNRTARRAAVVAEQNVARIGVRPDHRDAAEPRRVERQRFGLILQENEALPRRFESQGAVCVALDDVAGRIGPIRIEHAEAELHAKLVPERPVEIFPCDEPGPERFPGAGVRIGRHVDAALQFRRDPFRIRPELSVFIDKRTAGSGVADDRTVESPLPAQDVGQQPSVHTARDPVHGVVGAHDRLRARLHALFESGQIGLAQILLADCGIEAEPVLLRAGVDGEVLRRGDGLQMLRIASLHTAHVSAAEFAGQKRAFAVGLLPPAPARVAEDVDVRRPVGQPFVGAEISVTDRVGVTCVPLLRNHLAHPFDELRRESRRHGDRLRENGRRAAARQAVQRLVPPDVRRNSEPRNGGVAVTDKPEFLLDGQGFEQGVDALFERKGTVSELFHASLLEIPAENHILLFRIQPHNLICKPSPCILTKKSHRASPNRNSEAASVWAGANSPASRKKGSRSSKRSAGKSSEGASAPPSFRTTAGRRRGAATRASSPSTPPAAAAAAACANGTAYRKDGRSPMKRSPPSPRSCSAGSAPMPPEPASCRIRRICSDPKLLRRFAFLRKHDIFMTERKFQDKEECI